MAFRLLIIVALLYSCKTVETSESESSTEKSVIIEMYVYRPHCGGAVRSIEENGSTTIMANRKFFLDNQKGERLYIETSQEGKINLQLESGLYGLYSIDKELDSASFIRTKSRMNEYYHNEPPECFDLWRKSPDIRFFVTNDTLIKYIENTRCFTSNNPCIEYSGPLPP